jgi:NADPH:quinone reductase-like Zn-dependent oxidoreductase
MKAVRFDAYGGPDVLYVADVEEPHAGPGQIRVAVRAAGVNGMDRKIRAGYLAETVPMSRPPRCAYRAYSSIL